MSEAGEAAPKASIEVLHPGGGANFATVGDRVRIHYTGTLAANGSEFDCSRKKDREFSTQVGIGRVIKGLPPRPLASP